MTSSSQIIRVGLLSTDPEMSSWFCEDIGCIEENQCQTVTFSNRQLSFHEASSGEADHKSFDVYVGIIRFVDVLSLQKLDQLLADHGAGKFTPTLVLIYRNENETDFKMSCPYCGQKLWVRDVDQDKRGRCPHCSKGFTLPDQQEHIISTLRLPPSVHVKRITRQDPGSFAAPLRDMIQLASVENSLSNLNPEKNTFITDTMQVNIDDEGA
ncbi:hypothetical protein P3T73_09940 [Kiritimatiellota bacterium B12222]|nr:hypothetical protein P3T73_09940 [Kiritimatiellota bacterium B12222]